MCDIKKKQICNIIKDKKKSMLKLTYDIFSCLEFLPFIFMLYSKRNISTKETDEEEFIILKALFIL